MIEGEGFEEFQVTLAEFLATLEEFPEIAAGQLEQAMEQALMVLQGEAADYPAAPQDTTYRRTGTLGRRWVGAARVIQAEGSGAGLVGRVGNITAYAGLVQGPNDQLAVHKAHGWRTTKDIVRDNQEAIMGLLERAGGHIVEELAKGAG
jgi:hypothetical protein